MRDTRVGSFWDYYLLGTIYLWCLLWELKFLNNINGLRADYLVTPES